MAKIKVEISTKEALYAVNSISAVQKVLRKEAKHDKAYFNRMASLEALKENLMKAMKEQSDIKDLRKGAKIIKGE